MTVPDRFAGPGRSRVLDALANARRLRSLRRATVGRLPFLSLASDVRDIVYANWLVPVGRAAAFVPLGMFLPERGGLTLLTVLTYRHGHFGPAIAGPLRRLFPSPLQSNWRFHVAEIDGKAAGEPTVLFVRNVFDSALYAVGARLMSDALPAHVAARFAHRREGDRWRTEIDGGAGSAPSMFLETRRIAAWAMPPPFAAWFGAGAEQAVATICLQDRALVALPDQAAVAAAHIALPIGPATAEPLAVVGYRGGALLNELGATVPPWCFRVPAAAFAVLDETVLVGAPAKALTSRGDAG